VPAKAGKRIAIVRKAVKQRGHGIALLAECTIQPRQKRGIAALDRFEEGGRCGAFYERLETFLFALGQFMA
jgi:hypothetical protein